MSWSLSERLYLYCICKLPLHFSAVLASQSWVQVPAGVDVAQHAPGVCFPGWNTCLLYGVCLQHGPQPELPPPTDGEAL